MGNLLAESVVTDWVGIAIALVAVVIASVSLIKQSSNDARAIATQIIDARFAAFDAAQTEIQRRLERGDNHFDGLNERDRKLETALLSKLSEMKDWMHETFATKRDYETLAGRFDGFQRFIAKMETERKV